MRQMEHEYRLGLYEKAIPSTLSWEERFSHAKRAGFDYIELSIDESEERLQRLDWDDDAIRRFCSHAEEQGLSIGSICLSGHRSFPLGGDDEKRALNIMEKALHFASVGGIRIIQLAGYDVYYSASTPQSRKRFRRNLKKAVDLAAREGILMGFETMETPFMDNVKKAIRHVSNIDSPYLGIYPDIGNLNNAALLYGHSVTDDLKKGKGHLVAIHIKETLPGQYREVPFGTGQVDFDSLLKTAWELGVRQFVTELWHTGNDDWFERIVEAASMVRGILDRFHESETEEHDE